MWTCCVSVHVALLGLFGQSKFGGRCCRLSVSMSTLFGSALKLYLNSHGDKHSSGRFNLWATTSFHCGFITARNKLKHFSQTKTSSCPHVDQNSVTHFMYCFIMPDAVVLVQRFYKQFILLCHVVQQITKKKKSLSPSGLHQVLHVWNKSAYINLIKVRLRPSGKS